MPKAKLCLALVALMGLTACMGGGASVTQSAFSGPTACPGSPYMKVTGHPLRCGPQAASPVSY